ncbi:hypothetical protein HUR95_09650 [Caldalkalibacillus thermarum TA2.A1]|uniref:CNNM transmembrane domain-containing protein n=1 Tax=Caldalkalibacillus thermarum (strain TA2.A1) TaxID=986075 RepID=A0A8X8L906_CALTT|nr:hypothetical protein [Caldalkalibacillus thermarum]QZT32658.1 hypothetical protein HUR95_09650 [Caldalkalibacillus thermarum TA2.A1]
MKFSWKHALSWSTAIAVITLVLAAIFSIVSSFILSGAPLAIGMLVVIIIVMIGIVFDTIGIAATAANEVPFRSMASRKITGAKEAIYICRNADRFSSFCNDVIGDISGIVSGTASAVVILQLAFELGYAEGSALHMLVGVVFTSLVAALTVGGKALGKSFAIYFSIQIILTVGKVFYFINKKFHISILDGKNKKKNRRRSNGHLRGSRRNGNER